MTRPSRCLASGAAALWLGVAAAPALAQAQTGRLVITVLDSTGAVLPGAGVTVTALDSPPRNTPDAPIQASERGVVTLERLVPGRYSIQATFPGFQTVTLADVRIRAGENRQSLVLPLAKQEDSIAVTQDRQLAAADPRGPAFGSAVTREQIEALSDDPAELQQQLADMAGPGAVIRVDSFEGAALPPKAQIKSIHITRDGFAAENHNPNAFFVDIITQPGIGALRGSLSLRSRPGALSGRNLLTNTRGPEHTDDFSANINGPLLRDRASFSVFLNRAASYDTPAVNAVLADGTPLQVLALKAPQTRLNASALFDYAVTRDQTLRLGYYENQFENRNQGIGGFDLPDRAFATEAWNRGIYIQEAGPIGRRTFLNTRLNANVNQFTSAAAVEAPTIRVTDAFTSGGAQNSGGRHAGNLFFNSDLDYIRGIHSVRTGVQLQWTYYRADTNANYLGTYTFDSVEAYQAGRPSNYTRRLGDPLVKYGGPIGGIYVQDDIRVSKALTLSPGLRYEQMIHIDKWLNFGPRFGVTWAPFATGRTTLRASAGIFYDYLGADNYEQTIRVNGLSQREVNIVNPSYPDPGDLGAAVPGNRYLFADQMAMPRNGRLSAGVDQTFSPKARVSVTYSYVRGDRLFRGQNLNPPIDGVRADPAFANVVQVAPDASTRQHQLTTSANITLSGTPAAQAGAAPGRRVDWRRVAMTTTYTLGRLRNNTDGTFAVPFAALEDEWGPMPNDVTHRLFVSMNNQTLRNLSAVVTLSASSGTPYTIRTGSDDNGDGIFNDRPDGFGRNSERGPAQWFASANLTYTIPLGRQPGAAPPGGIGVVRDAPGSAPTIVAAGRPASRYRLQVGVNAQNLTNHQNYVGFSGVETSRFFRKATAVANPRKVDVTISLSF